MFYFVIQQLISMACQCSSVPDNQFLSGLNLTCQAVQNFSEPTYTSNREYHTNPVYNLPKIIFWEPKRAVIPEIYEFWNTISSVSYIFVGFQLVRRNVYLGQIIIMVGISSAFFHATGTVLGEIIEEFTTLFFLIELKKILTRKNISIIYLIYYLAIFFHSFHLFYFLSVILITDLTIDLLVKSRRTDQLINFYEMVGLFSIAKVFWITERITGWWELHVFWHIISAIVMGYASIISKMS